MGHTQVACFTEYSLDAYDWGFTTECVELATPVDLHGFFKKMMAKNLTQLSFAAAVPLF